MPPTVPVAGAPDGCDGALKHRAAHDDDACMTGSTTTAARARPASDRAWHVLALAVAAVAAVEAAFRFGDPGDYPVDAKASVDALARGDVAHAFSEPALMGPISIVLRAPVVALADLLSAGGLATYRAGAAACLLVVAFLAWRLALAARSPSRTGVVVVLLVVLAVLNPASVAAVRYGHPEEALCAALCVAAVVLARHDRVLAAAVLLGLALATKQWAVLAVAPALLAAAPGSRLRLGLVSLGVGALAMLPTLVVDLHGFGKVTHQVSQTGLNVVRTTWWFPLAQRESVPLSLPHGYPDSFVFYRAPDWLGTLAHPIIVGIAVPVALIVYRRRGAIGCRDSALAALALLLLLRCTLDPVDNAYYHLPLLLALLAWETTSTTRTLPVVTLLTAAALWVTYDVVEAAVQPAVASAVYGAWTVALFAYLVSRLGLRAPRQAEPGYSGPVRLRLRSQ
jgi:hypothetical protein